ncbi:3-ketoacyl-acyl carrier protein synthase III [Actinidia rufa]|uniref:3-ketoacyl-acyl carrier protein synthase III n=1 Tax=Actinidia rufa TaxID=165716 RepID=A0A7J0G854_9ERIC|nr:3-ketoacyl-acyl carrier protein synthase III [Actinidia rufa]
MANASGFCSPTVPSLKKRISPSIGVYRSGFCSSEGISRRVSCASTVEGPERLGPGVSPSESRIPRLVSKGCKLVGCGSAVPTLQVSNDDLAKIVDTSDEWIAVRTGIRNRRVITGKDSLTTLAVEAAKNALQMAEVDPDDLDLVLLCTSTPDDLFGSAPQIQRALGCKRNPLAYDITAACSGFVLGLISAACYIRGGGFNNVLVIGADALSRHVDWTDRGTCILFGDAAGAVVVQACDSEDDGLFGFDLHSDGDGQRFVLSSSLENKLCASFSVEIELIFTQCRHLNASFKENEVDHALGSNGSVLGFPPRRSSYSCIQMNGTEVFRFAVRCVPQSIESALKKAGLTGSSIDWLLLHQANQRIIDAVATRLEVPPERVISNLANYGNTSAASIPLALDEAVRSGKVQSGHTIAAAGFGAGLTWGSAIVRWG